MPLDVLDRESLLGAEVWFVLTISWGGVDYRLSSGTFEIPTDDGERLQVLDCISDTDWANALALFSDSIDDVSVPFSVVIPGVDVAARIARGHDLSSARGELARWVSGTTWEQRQVLVRGDISEPGYGAALEPVTFSLTTAPYADRSALVSALGVVDEVSWPDAAPRSQGANYPRILGSPGYLSAADRVAGSPGYVVDQTNRHLLVADGPVVASGVWIRNVTQDTVWASRSVTTRTDGRGVLVSTVTLATGDGDVTDEYVVSWPLEGGMQSPYGSGALTLAGDVLMFMLERSTLSVDLGRTAAAVQLLSGFAVSGYYDEAVGAWEWVKGNLLPLLPVSIVTGPDGVYPVVWRYWATAQDAVEHIDADQLDAERVSDVQYAQIGSVANDIRVAFGLSIEGDRFARQVRATGNPEVRATDADQLVFSNSVLRVSWSRYGEALHEIESDIVYDPVTASQVATWLAYAFAVTTRSVSYLAAGHYRWLQLGDVVTLTDSDLHWDHQLCWVESIADDDVDQVELALRTIEAPGLTQQTPASLQPEPEPVDLSVFPTAALWGLYNAYNQSEGGGNGDLFTPGASYGFMADQSGNEHHLTDRSASNPTPASLQVFPGRFGDVAVPETTGSARLFHNTGSDERLSDFMMVHLSPWDTGRNNGSSEWQLIRGGTSGILMQVRFTSTGSLLTVDWNGSAGSISTSIPIPNAGTGATDGWVMIGVSCRGTTSSTEEYRFVVIYDFGAGPVLAGDNTFTTAAALLGTTDSQRDTFRGVMCQGVGEKPLMALYTAADSGVFEDALIAAAAQRGNAEALAVRALL